MYQVLYRKWRPAVFSDTVGQPHIAKTLLSQLLNNRLAHAYLFTGSRGTGKTTFAKILARAVNCEQPVGGEPCNSCPTCLGILNGSIPDVAEIDAASHSGVDNIRALREETFYSPVAARYRVYIIDEVHMLSTGAFNALLKTLEEPPPHVLFILATTEIHKIPVTISSRCQRFAFRRISEPEISALLEQICLRESIDIKPAALQLLSHLADGAMRDALSLLEQCVSVGSTISEELVRETLGLSGLSDLSDWLLELHDLSLSLNRLNSLYSSGIDFSSILSQLSSLLRDLLMGQLLNDLLITRLSPNVASALSVKWPMNLIMQAISHIQESQNRLSKTADKRLETEMCLVRLASLQCEQTDDTVSLAPISTAPHPSITPPIQQSKTVSKSNLVANNNIPIIENSIRAEEKEEFTPSSAIRADAKRDARWPTFLASLNPLHQSAVSKSRAEIEGERLIITAIDPFTSGLLKSTDFEKNVITHFPGGVVLDTDEEQVSAPLITSLDAFLEEQDDLVIKE